MAVVENWHRFGERRANKEVPKHPALVVKNSSRSFACKSKWKLPFFNVSRSMPPCPCTMGLGKPVVPRKTESRADDEGTSSNRNSSADTEVSFNTSFHSNADSVGGRGRQVQVRHMDDMLQAFHSSGDLAHFCSAVKALPPYRYPSTHSSSFGPEAPAGPARHGRQSRGNRRPRSLQWQSWRALQPWSREYWASPPRLGRPLDPQLAHPRCEQPHMMANVSHFIV